MGVDGGDPLLQSKWSPLRLLLKISELGDPTTDMPHLVDLGPKTGGWWEDGYVTGIPGESTERQTAALHKLLAVA